MKMKIRDILKECVELIRHNLWQAMLVVVIAETLALLFANQISSRLLEFALINAKVDGINNHNYMTLLKHPAALFLLFLIIILLAVFVILQMCAVIAFADRGYHEEPTKLRNIFKPLLRMRFNPWDIVVFLLFIFVILPFGNAGVTNTITSNLKIPLFILEYIFSIRWLEILYYFVGVVLFYLNVRYFFAFVIFYNENLTFVQSMKKSRELTKGRFFEIIRLLLAIAAVTIVATVVTTVGIMFIGGFIADAMPQREQLILAIVSTSILFVTTIIVAVSSVYLIQATVVFYHKCLGHRWIKHETTKNEKRFSKLVMIGTVVFFVLITVGVYYDKPIDVTNPGTIISHRGESVDAVENTIEALELANKQKADYVELDIQEIADGSIVVYHDPNLKRLAGVSGRTDSFDWQTMKDITISTNGNIGKIPLFDDYLKRAAELDQKLLIEIKTNPNDSDEFLAKIIDLVKKHGLENQVMYQSIDKNAILELKAQYPDVTAGYIIGINIGGLEELNIDFYSIEDSSVTPRVLADVNRMKKGLFVWTINDEDLMSVYFRTQVSGIITDNVPDARELRSNINAKETILIEHFFSFLD